MWSSRVGTGCQRLDALPLPRVRFGQGGDPISAKAQAGYDFNRLERAVSALADALANARGEAAELRQQRDEYAQRIRSLEGELLEANQKRQDVGKCLEELIAQIDHLEGDLEGSDR